MKKWLFGLAVLAGVGAVVKKILGERTAEWQGLTGAEVRQKLEDRIPSRVPDDRRTAVADRVVAKMRDRGALVDEDDERPGAESDAGGTTEEPEPGGSTVDADGSKSDGKT
ncbi:MAG: hypothetical protein OEV40_11795 [Acidimicrobiia bacterium]|nr:hypothetical protein [Acidimicrobiia bacterium]